MRKRFDVLCLAAIISLQPLASVVADIPAAADLDSARRDWSPVLVQMGIQEGKGITSERYALILNKLATLPPICLKIRQSSPKPISLADWIHILKGLGVEPKPAMSEGEWTVLLAKAGVDVSKGMSAPLPPTPAVAKEATPTTTSPQVSSPTVTAPQISTPTAAAQLPVVPVVAKAVSPELPAPPPIRSVSKTITKTISLDLRGMEITEVLKLIARQGDLSMVTASSVHGTVTLLLKDIEIWEALRQVLQATDLAYAFDGKVVRIMPSGDYEKLYGVRFDDQSVVDTLTLKNVKASSMSKYLETVKSRIGKIVVYDYSNALVLIDTPEAISKMKQMADSFDRQMDTKVFSLNYAKAKELLPKVLPLATKEVGSIEMDERTNRIIVMDYPDHIQKIDAVVQAFDQRHRAVLIEAKIVQIGLTSDYKWGVNWGAVFSHVGKLAIPAGLTGSFIQVPIVPPGTPAVAPGQPGAAGPNPAFTASLGTLSQNNFTAIIQALQTVGKSNLLSAPRISVLNNETANILVGTKEAYVTTSVLVPGVGAQTTTEQINFIDVGVKLHVTPAIGEDGFITMKIKPEVSSVDHTLVTATGNSVPIVRTTQAETSVLVKDGETLLLGGLIENDKTITDNGVPILSRIPLLGLLFKSRTKTGQKSEIAVFLTPRIQTDGPKTAAAGASEVLR